MWNVSAAFKGVKPSAAALGTVAKAAMQGCNARLQCKAAIQAAERYPNKLFTVSKAVPHYQLLPLLLHGPA